MVSQKGKPQFLRSEKLELIFIFNRKHEHVDMILKLDIHWLRHHEVGVTKQCRKNNILLLNSPYRSPERAPLKPAEA